MPAAEAGTAHPAVQHVLVREKGRISFLHAEDVRWIEAEGNYVRFHLASGSRLVRESLGRIGERLDFGGFVRIHRSRAVNLDHVRDVVRGFGSDYLVRLYDGTELRLSRTFWRSFKERLGSR